MYWISHVAQEYFSPLLQHPLLVSTFVRGHTLPLLSAIHHLNRAAKGCAAAHDCYRSGLWGQMSADNNHICQILGAHVSGGP